MVLILYHLRCIGLQYVKFEAGGSASCRGKAARQRAVCVQIKSGDDGGRFGDNFRSVRSNQVQRGDQGQENWRLLAICFHRIWKGSRVLVDAFVTKFIENVSRWKIAKTPTSRWIMFWSTIAESMSISVSRSLKITSGSDRVCFVTSFVFSQFSAESTRSWPTWISKSSNISCFKLVGDSL